ncbi:hypothetical protein PENSPDRAFT_693787 [Peniophora sp. CONT]|nr:hypothetical protein PENSPDRAFT_693996 [Peniophora sp. CONT]KZV60747.1 hypothetical protein PENSPDRAFT_694000 [Peniophora sp. CONT]KZV60996.1 hypothetical protein PENSPDRAFT_693787 [Peniophora sp. CONT]
MSSPPTPCPLNPSVHFPHLWRYPATPPVPPAPALARRARSSVTSISPDSRIEYKEPETEFVLENFDISALNLLHGVTDIDITAPQDAATKITIASIMHLQIKMVEFEVSTDAQFEVKQSDHAALLMVFKPLLSTRLR